MESPYRVRRISYAEILPIWTERLWPERKSRITPSHHIDIDGHSNPELHSADVSFWGVTEGESGDLLGVVSGLRTSSSDYRSRGIWVAPHLRKRGIGRLLIRTVEEQALREGCHKVWSMARQTSIEFYQRVGFSSIREETRFEYGPHEFVVKPVCSN